MGFDGDIMWNNGSACGCGKAQKAYKQAVALAENGSYEKAAASFKEAIAENKDKAEYYIDYGMTLNHLGSYKKGDKAV